MLGDTAAVLVSFGAAVFCVGSFSLLSCDVCCVHTGGNWYAGGGDFLSEDSKNETDLLLSRADGFLAGVGVENPEVENT